MIGDPYLFVQSLCSLAWHMDLDAFCQATDRDPAARGAQDDFQDFQWGLSRLSRLDRKTITKLAVLAQEATESHARRNDPV